MGCNPESFTGEKYLFALMFNDFLLCHLSSSSSEKLRLVLLFCLCPDHSVCTCPEKMPQMPMMTRMLKTADPTIVPTPTSPFVMNTPKNTEQERVSHKSSPKIILI